MNPQQRSITLAFVVIAAGMAVNHHWISSLATWAGAPPKGGPSGNPVPSGGVKDWQAGIVLYAIMMLVAETQFSAVMPPIAWAAAVIELIAAYPELQKEYPTLFNNGVTAATTTTPAHSGAQVGTPQPTAATN